MKNSKKTSVTTTARKTVRTTTTSAPKAAKAPAKAPAEPRIPTQEEIAIRSYEIFLRRGAADGHHVEDWLQAEAELTGR
jgi:hypothetical protein